MSIELRSARESDLEAIVAMLADDPLGAQRESPGLPLDRVYREAFAAIEENPHDRIIVASEGDRVLGCLQLSFLPGLSHRGAWRAQIESVRVAATERGRGLGELLVEHARERAIAKGCRMLQLTTDQSREDALRFYERLGFRSTHWGMKLPL